jgi:hypothetical protein
MAYRVGHVNKKTGITYVVNFLIISYSTKIGTLPNTNKALIILA